MTRLHRAVILRVVAIAAVAFSPAGSAFAAAPASQPAVSAEAQAVLTQVSAAYAKLKSLDLTGKLSGEFDVDGHKESPKADFTSSYAAPNRFRHKVEGDAEMGSTGEKLFIFLKPNNVYVMEDAPKEKVLSDKLPEPFSQVLGAQNLSLALAMSSDPAVELTHIYTQIDKAADVKIDDKSFTALKLSKPEGPTTTLLIDPATSMVRRATIDMSPELKARGAADVKSALLTIDYTAIKPDAPTSADQFAWAPPAGARDAKQAQGEAETGAAGALVGQPAPDFKLKSLDDKEVALADQKGKVVVLDFWATWCGPCVASLPKLDKMNQELKEKGVSFFAVNQSEDKALVEKFMTSKNLTIPVLLDNDGKVNGIYKAEAIPQTVVIGKDGVIAKVFVGAGPDTEKELRAAVEAAMKAGK